MGKNITVYVSDETLDELVYVRFEDALGPTDIFARGVKREASRIRKLRQRQATSLGAGSGNSASADPQPGRAPTIPASAPLSEEV